MKVARCPTCGGVAYLGTTSLVCRCGYTFYAKEMAAVCPLCRAPAARVSGASGVSTICFSCGHIRRKPRKNVPHRLKKKG
jgi:hypothetical protein